MTKRPVLLRIDRRWPAEVDIWHVVMPFGEPVDIPTLRLDEAERQRASRYLHEEDRIRFAVTRSTLRHLLGRYLDVNPLALEFVTTRHGRPELASLSGPMFNVSHAGEHALIAISREFDVGIDVEFVNAAIDWRELAALVCTLDEQRLLDMAPRGLQNSHFFQCWTAKEALLKALGVGIAEGLQAISVVPGAVGSQSPLVRDGSAFAKARSLTFHWIMDIPGYMACIAHGRCG